MNSEMEQLIEIFRNSNNMVFFGGAGMSTESGIPDFRSSNGLWNEKLKVNIKPEELVSHTYFKKYPEEFFEFYKDKLIYPKAEPNVGHIALAKLEEKGKLKGIVTQNIDGLHQKAGSKKVCELHGSVLRNYCTNCHTFYDEKFILESEGVPTCPKCNAIVKPDVVLYEEGLDNEVVVEAVKLISSADTLIIGGTSLVVYPAAGLINYFRGKNIVLINKGFTSADSKANLIIRDSIGKVLEEAVNNM